MMSSVPDVEAADMCCACCGVTGGDDKKLKTCTACKLVRYCSVQCQKEHRSQHKITCKKRAAELREELLFKQPESTHLGDCPICFIPLALDYEKFSRRACCTKIICHGCLYANHKREMEEFQVGQKCPYCRTPLPKDDAEVDRMAKRRIEANDPCAIMKVGSDHYDEGDYESAFEYYAKAAKLGDMEAHQQLGHMYMEGKGVELDMKKAIYHWEEAAIGGHPSARSNLGVLEGQRGRYDKAAKHFIIAANQGFDVAVEHLKEGYKGGHVSKDVFGEALRAYQGAVDATKSPHREAAEHELEVFTA